MEVTNSLVANHIHKTGSNIFKECLGRNVIIIITLSPKHSLKMLLKKNVKK